MPWYVKRGRRVHGEGSFAAALVARGYAPEPGDVDQALVDVDSTDGLVEVEVGFDVSAVPPPLTPEEQDLVDQVLRDEGGVT